jgi:hypothetical protein
MHLDLLAPLADIQTAAAFLQHHITLAMPIFRILLKPSLHGLAHRLAHILRHHSHTAHRLLRWEYATDVLMLAVGVGLDLLPEGEAHHESAGE